MIGAENQSRMFAFVRGDANTLFAVFNRHSDPQTFTFQFGNTDGTAADPHTDFCVFGQSCGCSSSAERRESQYHLARFYRCTSEAKIGRCQDHF